MQQDLEARVERLEALHEIRQLAYRYALAVDSRDLDALVGLFVEDVRAGQSAVGRSALRGSFDRMLRGVGVTILNVGNHVIDLADRDHASGVVYCRGEIEVDGSWVVQAIQYRDTYERRQGRWFFVGRRHLLWYGADMLQRPIGLPPANGPRATRARGSCRTPGPPGPSSGPRGAPERAVCRAGRTECSAPEPAPQCVV
jgi:ketosteroid isomerase-like protein